MTVEELANLYGTRQYHASIGDSLFKVAREIYGSYDDEYLQVLTTLNTKFDWTNIKAGDVILYIEKSYVDVDQIW